MGRGAALGVIAALTAALTGCSADSPPSAASPSQSAVPDHDVQLQVQTAEVSGRRVAWARLGAGGAGSGDPLVLLNGTGSPMAEWDPMLLAELSRGRQVIVYDYPGLGGSQRLRGRLTFDRLADSLHGLLGALGLSQVDVLGWSMGTFVAQRLVVRHPQDVGHLILVGGNPGGSRTTLGPRWVQRADSDPDAGTDTYLRTNYPRIPCAQAAGRRFLDRQAAAVDSGRYPPDRVPPRTYDAMVAAEDPWLRSDRNAEELGRVTTPTLVMVGSEDVITPPPNSEQLQRLIPGSALLRLGVSGHSTMFQDPVASTRVVDAFLKGESATAAVVPTSCG